MTIPKPYEFLNSQGGPWTHIDVVIPGGINGKYSIKGDGPFLVFNSSNISFFIFVGCYTPVPDYESDEFHIVMQKLSNSNEKIDLFFSNTELLNAFLTYYFESMSALVTSEPQIVNPSFSKQMRGYLPNTTELVAIKIENNYYDGDSVISISSSQDREFTERYSFHVTSSLTIFHVFNQIPKLINKRQILSSFGLSWEQDDKILQTIFVPTDLQTAFITILGIFYSDLIPTIRKPKRRNKSESSNSAVQPEEEDPMIQSSMNVMRRKKMSGRFMQIANSMSDVLSKKSSISDVVNSIVSKMEKDKKSVESFDQSRPFEKSEVVLPSIDTFIKSDRSVSEASIDEFLATVPVDKKFVEPSVEPADLNELLESAISKSHANMIDVNSVFPVRKFTEISASFFDVAQPSRPYIGALKDAVDRLSPDNYCPFAYLVAVFFINGLIYKEEFITAMSELIEIVPDLAEVIALAQKMDSTEKQVSVFTCKVINLGLLHVLVSTIDRLDDWKYKYYYKGSAIESESLEALQLFDQGVDKCFLTLPIDHELIGSHIRSDDYRFVLFPVNIQLQFSTHDLVRSTIEQLTCFIDHNKETNVWKIITEVAQAPFKGVDEFSEFAKKVKKAGKKKKSSHGKLKKLIKMGVRNKQLPLWFMFIIAHRQITTKYYYPESAVTDPYRILYVVSIMHNAIN